MRKGVSLIICTYNGSKLLEPTIEHIVNQQNISEFEWEVLFINNASTDNTEDVIMNNWKSSIPMRIILEKKKGLINARIRGLAESKYDIVSFIDDDNWIEPNWINEVYSTFKNNPNIGIVGGQNNAKYEMQPKKWFKWIEESFAVGSQGVSFEDITQTRGYVWGAGLSLRKEVYLKLIEAGFSFFLTGRSGKKLSAGEDTELCYAYTLAGYQIWYNENMRLTHFIPANRLEWNKIVSMFKGFGHAHTVLQIYRLFIENDQSIFHIVLKNTRTFLEKWLERRKGRIKNKVGNGKYLGYVFAKRLFIGTVLNTNFLSNYRSIKKFNHRIKNLKINNEI